MTDFDIGNENETSLVGDFEKKDPTIFFFVVQTRVKLH